MSRPLKDRENNKFDSQDRVKVSVEEDNSTTKEVKVTNTSSDSIPVTLTNPGADSDLEVTVKNATSDPVPVVIQNVDSNIDVEVSIPATVDINDTTPIDVNVTNTSVNTNATIQGTPNVNVSNSEIKTKNQLEYTATDITALGSSTNITEWTSALADGVLTKEFVESYHNEFEQVNLYTHPNLGDGNKALKKITQYTTQNNGTVVESIDYEIIDWNKDAQIQGSVSISAGAITSPDPNSSSVSIHTVVTTLTITDNTLGAVTLSLSGTDASHYHLHEVETGTHSQSTLAVVEGRTYQVHAHSGFPTGSSYTHSITVTATGDVFGVSDSVNINTSGTMTTSSSWSNTKYVVGPAYYGTTSNSVYGVYTETNNGGFLSTTANTQDYSSSAMTLNFWAYVPSATKTSSSTIGLICDMYGYHARLIELQARDSSILLTTSYATGYASSRATIVRNQWNMYTIVLDSNTVGDCDMYIQTSSTFDNVKKNTVNFGTGSTWNASGNAIGVSTIMSPFGYNNAAYPTSSSATNWDGVTGVRLDEITVWNKALSLTEIEELSNNHTVMDPTTHSAYTSDSTVLKRYVRFGDGDNDVENSVQCDVDSSFVMNKESTFITDTRITSY